MPYPAFLQGRVYKGSMSGTAQQCVRSLLANEAPGTFAFFQFDKPAMETSGIPGAAPTPMTMERALGLTGGSHEFAKLMMTQADETQIGMAVVTPDKTLRFLRLNCEQTNLQFRTLNDLLADMQRNGIPVDPQKMHFPGMAYMAQDFGDE